MATDWLIEQTGTDDEWDVSRSGRYSLMGAYLDEATRYVRRRLEPGEQATVRDDDGFETRIIG